MGDKKRINNRILHLIQFGEKYINVKMVLNKWIIAS